MFCTGLRSHRSNRRFLLEADFEEVLRWARRRTCAGVLAIGQPVVVPESKAERNLRSFPRQHERLLDALGAAITKWSGLSGDLQCGRIASVALGNAGARRVEVISSRLSNLTGLNGIATNVAKADPANFPPAADAAALGRASRPVDYFTDGGRARSSWDPEPGGRYPPTPGAGRASTS